MKSMIISKMMGVMLFSLLVATLNAQGVKIGDNPGTITPSAVLELEKTNQGLLITRVALLGATDNSTIPSPANSLLVYNLATAGGSGNEVYPGFYYWDNGVSRWKGLMTSAGPAGDVWIDGYSNLLSVNSADQSLLGSSNVALGNGAFGDLGGPSNYNVAIGYGVCNSETTMGDACVVALGMNTAFFNSGRHLNAMGMEAALNNFGEYVTAIGNSSAFNNAGTNVNALGPYAAHDNSGNDVNAFGADAAFNNIGYGINALNEGAGRNNEGSLVNLLGPVAGENNIGWSVNLMGSQSGQNNTGSEVNAMGAMSAQGNTAASVNAFGLEAGRYNTGYGLNAMGYWAAKWNNGGNAVAIGEQALIGAEFVTEGEGNIGIGYHAGISVGTGYRNICIGWDTDIPNPSANDQINIGNNIIREADGMIRLQDFIRLTPLDSPPSTTEEGSVYYDSSLQKLRVYTSTGWQNLN